jgi:putative ABC transport system permease protein
MLQWKIAWREMRRHPVRALLTWLSVVIGVAAVLAVGLSTGSARRAYREMYETITGRAALEITAPGGGALPNSLLPVVRETPGVAAAVPLIQRQAIMYYNHRRMTLVAMGIDPTLDSAVRDYELVAGDSIATKNGVWLDASLARNLGIKVGSEIKLLVRRGFDKTVVVGLIKPRSGSAVSGGAVLLMPLPTAQRRFAARGQLDRIQVVLADQADVAAMQTELVRRLPAGTQVKPPITHSSMADETMLALENGLHLATAFSLLAAMFIIMNTFLMNVGQRRRQLAVMRAIGATRRQIAGLVFRESLLTAVLGTLTGIAAGLGVARLMNGTMSSLFQTPLPPIELRPLPLILAVAFGLGVSLLGAALPARKAARLTPLEGMSGIAREDFEGSSSRSVVVGALAMLVSIGLFAVCLIGWLPFEWSVVVAVLLLISLVLLLPTVLRPMTYLGQLALAPLAVVESRLARRQLLRHGGRTTLTVGVLFVAVSTGLGLANSVVDNVNDVRHWYRTAIVGDFFVRAAMPDMETGLSASMPDSVGKKIQAIPGVTRMDSVRFVSATANDQPVIVVATRNEFRSPSEPEQVGVSAFASAPSGERVSIGSVLAQRTGLKTGDSIALETREGPRKLPIVEVANDYVAGGLTVHMNRPLAERLLGVEGVDAYVVKADHARLKQVEQALGELCAKDGLLLQSYADLTQLIEGMMAGVVGSLWGLLVLGLIVAVFGVVNTLGMNVLEQTRELGLLRVVAMTRAQVRKAIVAQAAMLGLMGIAPGLLAAVAMAYIMNLSTLPVIGHPIAFTWHPLLLLAGFAVAMAMVMAAAWIPAERAARLQLSAALRYE